MWALTSRLSFSSNSSRRLPPAPFARYMATSASRSMLSGSLSGSCETDTPTLASSEHSAVPSWKAFSIAWSTRSAKARHGVAVAHQLFKALGDGDQQFVADLVPEVVIDCLEAVEIDEQQGYHA